MKLSFYGKTIHFYMWFGKFATKIIMIFMLIFSISLILVLSVPQFSLHKPGTEISHFIPLAIAQIIVGITFLASLIGGVPFLLLLGFMALLEIPIELLLRRKVYKLVKEAQKISIAELATKSGVLENELLFLMQYWIIKPQIKAGFNKINTKTQVFKHKHLQLDLGANELSWLE